MSPILDVRDLQIRAKGILVSDVSFTVARGEALGLVGESGSGKSLTLKAIMSLLPRGVRLSSGSIESRGQTAMIFQDPLSALDPLMKVGKQLSEVCHTTGGLDRGAAKRRSRELLDLVHLPDPGRQWHAYPHQLSGGQRQRVVIAIALATNPDVLLCDEPTTALDVTVQRQILSLLEQLRGELGLAMVFVSHDLAVVGSVCSRVIVMSRGRVVERAEMAQLVAHPQHPYTRMLMNAMPVVPRLATDEGTGQRG